MRKNIVTFALMAFIINGISHADESVFLDNALKNAAISLSGRIREGTMVVVFGFNSPTKELSEYIMNGIIDHLIRENGMKVVERQNPELIRQEMEIQYSGDVSDEYIQSIGQQFGGETIITGSLVNQGETYLMRLRMIHVQTAQIISTYIDNIRIDTKLV